MTDMFRQPVLFDIDISKFEVGRVKSEGIHKMFYDTHSHKHFVRSLVKHTNMFQDRVGSISSTVIIIFDLG